jgi:acyl-CoA synthetase (AMP-forming)/AMP-acid ligase II
MPRDWHVCDLLNTLSARGRHQAVIAFTDGDTLTWDSETLARHALRMARSLRQLDKNSRIVLWAPNSLRWVAGALGVMAAGHVLVPLDEMADAAQLEMALASADPRLILTTAEHVRSSGDILRRRDTRTVLLDAAEPVGTECGDAAGIRSAAGSGIRRACDPFLDVRYNRVT